MKRPAPAWHARAISLRAGGAEVADIARYFGKAHSTVAWVLDENGDKAATRARIRAQRVSNAPAQAELRRLDRIARCVDALADALGMDPSHLMCAIERGRGRGAPQFDLTHRRRDLRQAREARL